jgi:hypothetical protein
MKPLSAVGCRRSATAKSTATADLSMPHKTAVGTKSRYRRSAVGDQVERKANAKAYPSLRFGMTAKKLSAIGCQLSATTQIKCNSGPWLRFGSDKSTLITPFFAAKVPLKGRIRHVKVRILALICS